MTCAVLFARHPAPGRVKTRLLTHLGPEEAARLYGAFLRDSVKALRGSSAQRQIVAGAEASQLPALRAFLQRDDDGQEVAGLEFLAQPAGDLGHRMGGIFASVFDGGARRALILGTDSPSLPPSTIDESLATLAEADVILGPSVDGGYYLVGMTAAAYPSAAPALFDGIDWSTGAVMAQSVAALPAALRLALRPPWYDVDHAHEAAFLRDHLTALARAGEPVAGHSLRELARLDLPAPS